MMTKEHRVYTDKINTKNGEITAYVMEFLPSEELRAMWQAKPQSERFIAIEESINYIKSLIEDKGIKGFRGYDDNMMILGIVEAVQKIYEGGGAEEVQAKYLSMSYIDEVIDNLSNYKKLPKVLQNVYDKYIGYNEAFYYEIPEKLDGPHFYTFENFLKECKSQNFVALSDDETKFFNYLNKLGLTEETKKEVLLTFIKELPNNIDMDYKVVEDDRNIYIFRKKEAHDFNIFNTSKLYEYEQENFEVEFDRLKLENELKPSGNRGMKI